MEKVGVSPSDIRSIGYDPSEHILEIAFLRGGVYQYEGVPEYVYKELMNASSHG